MDDNEIKKLLDAYVNAEMSLIDMNDYDVNTYTVSTKYKKKIKKLFSVEKYFGSKLYLGYTVRRIAIVVIIILSLLTANEVSARIFGFHPWKFVTSFLSDSKMDVKTYTGKTSDISRTEFATIKRDVPLQIPDRFEQVTFENDKAGLYVEWNNGDEYLQYSRHTLSSNITIAVDGEYQSKEKITIADFAGDFCVKNDETWIIWDDEQYNHMIIATSVENSKELLLDMAESLYK